MSQKSICKINSFIAGEPLPAIAVSFDCGHLMREDALQVTCDVLGTQARGVEPPKKVLVLGRKNQLYAGHPSQTESICNTMFLIRNRRTGKGKLVLSSKCQLINCTHRKSSSQNSSVVGDNRESSKRSALAETFGSKKMKRSSEIAQRLKATTASDSAVLEETIGGMNHTMEIDNEVPSDNSVVAQLLPPCNRQATSLEEVYSIDRLFTYQEMEELKGIAQLYMSAEDVAADPEFHVLPFFNALGENRSLSQVQLLVYANSLINFTRLSAYEISNRTAVDKASNHSKIMALKMLKLFSITSGAKRVRSPALTDRAYCHAMVAILLACDYKFNVEWFFRCLKGCRRTKLYPLLRVIGLVPISRSLKETQFTHHLKLPLPPISLTVTKRGKK